MNTKRARIQIVLLGVLLSASFAAATDPVGALGYRAADPNAPPVTQRSLIASERFWPYRVVLTRAWQPPGRPRPIASGEAGVLVRIDEKTGLARIDFGGPGVYEVPVERTDLIDSANRIRLGDLGKIAPNFITAFGPRLIDTAADTPQSVKPEELLERSGFLCVFADPSSDAFPELVKALAPLADHRGVTTVLFPQGKNSDRDVWQRLHALDWKVPYVYAHLSAGYTDSLLPAKTQIPVVQLQTREGRLLLQTGWSPKLEASLRAKIDASFAASAR
jgi:hypothetical protein